MKLIELIYEYDKINIQLDSKIQSIIEQKTNVDALYGTNSKKKKKGRMLNFWNIISFNLKLTYDPKHK